MKGFLCLALMLCALSPAYSQPQPAPPQNDLAVTAIPLEINDVARMMGIHLWRFKIHPTAPNVGINYRLELRRPDKTATVMDSTGFGSSASDAELTFGLMPKDGEPLDSAKTLRTYTRFSSDGGGITAGTYCDNPIRTPKVAGYSVSPLGEINPDGSVILMRFNTRDTENPGERQLVLMLTSTKPAGQP